VGYGDDPCDLEKRVDGAHYVILSEHHHLQGLVLGTAMLLAAAAGLPAAVHAARDLAKMPPPAGEVATQDPLRN
jgi:hypothetical protein